jgi:hypothetical protein
LGIPFGYVMERRQLSVEARFHANVQKTQDDGCWLWTGRRNERGYGTLNDSKDNGYRALRANRVALSLALGRELLPEEHALHACDNPPCCRVGPGHIYLGSHDANMKDKVARGRQPRGEQVAQYVRGERCGTSKLTDETVRAIRNERRALGTPYPALAAKYGVGSRAVENACIGKTWKHVREADRE